MLVLCLYQSLEQTPVYIGLWWWSFLVLSALWTIWIQRRWASWVQETCWNNSVNSAARQEAASQRRHRVPEVRWLWLLGFGFLCGNSCPSAKRRAAVKGFDQNSGHWYQDHPEDLAECHVWWAEKVSERARIWTEARGSKSEEGCKQNVLAREEESWSICRVGRAACSGWKSDQQGKRAYSGWSACFCPNRDRGGLSCQLWHLLEMSLELWVPGMLCEACSEVPSEQAQGISGPGTSESSAWSRLNLDLLKELATIWVSLCGFCLASVVTNLSVLHLKNLRSALQVYWLALHCNCTDWHCTATVLTSTALQLYWLALHCNCTDKHCTATVLTGTALQLHWQALHCNSTDKHCTATVLTSTALTLQLWVCLLFVSFFLVSLF